MKSKGVAYVLWFFLGLIGVHRFYCDRWVSGIIWLCTFGLFGIGWLVDLFLIPGMVDHANLKAAVLSGARQSQNVIVNIQHPTVPSQQP